MKLHRILHGNPGGCIRMKMLKRLVKKSLGIFDRHFVHLFVSAMHLFFICLSAWLGRYDLVSLGMVIFPVSFFAFGCIGGRCAADSRDEGKS